MRILGIDPGLQITGYGVVDYQTLKPRLVDGGVIRLTAKAPLADRLVELQTELRGLIEEHKPEICAVEQLYSHYAHPRTAILMGHAARGDPAGCPAVRRACRAVRRQPRKAVGHRRRAREQSADAAGDSSGLESRRAAGTAGRRRCTCHRALLWNAILCGCKSGEEKGDAFYPHLSIHDGRMSARRDASA